MPLEPPSAVHWLGTDALGRDVLHLILTSLTFTAADVLLAAIIAVMVGTAIALSCAMLPTWVSRCIFSVTVTFSFATPLIAVLLFAYRITGDHALLFPTVTGMLLWAIPETTIHAALLQNLNARYVKFAQSLGLQRHTILIRLVLPNLAPHIWSSFVALIPPILSANILVAFLGIGTTTVRLGGLLKMGYEFFPACWWLWLPSTLVVFICFLIFLRLTFRNESTIHDNNESLKAR